LFTEILRIKPKLDPGSAKQMEQTLSDRFARVSRRFGQGLRSVIKGTVLGISLGLLTRLLNPLQAIEDKIKNLLGQGTDARELADRLGTDPGRLRQLQDVAGTLGVTPEAFKDMLMKYAGAVEKAREELQNPFEAPSQTTIAVREFAGEKDLVKGFTDFITSLKAVGQGEGDFVPLSDRAKRIFSEAQMSGKQVSQKDRERLISSGEIRSQSGTEARQAFEKQVFGEAQTGAARRLIESDLSRIRPDTRLNNALQNTASLADQKRALDIAAQTQDFIKASENINSGVVTAMAKAEADASARETKQLESFADLRKAANGVEELKSIMVEVSNVAAKGLGYLGEFSVFIQSLKNSRVFRGMFGGRD